jgi:beta-glucosidase
MKKATFLFFLISIIHSTMAQTEPKLGQSADAEVRAAMTLEEKARLLVGMGMRIPGLPANFAQGPVVGQTEDNVPGAAGTTAAIERLAIPTIVLADGPAGLRISPERPGEEQTFYCTAFPIATLLASTWDAELVYQVGEAMGKETKEYGVDILLAPGMNIQRNALGGRNFEYYSEDPLLTGKMAAAMVNGIQSNGVGTSIKHFAANNHETNRNTINVKVGQRALREIYLRGFEIAVKESKPWTVMSSYNKLNGTYTSQSADLLKKILRQDWGYEGVVMTDWFGGDNPVEQMRAGNDLLMPGTPQQLNGIVEAVQTGALVEKHLDENASNMLALIKKTPSFQKYPFSNQPDLKAHAEVARRAAAEGIVLLQNKNQALPLASGKAIAAFGNHAYDLISGGTGSGDVNEAYTISLPEGLQEAGFKLDKLLQANYEAYLKAEKAKHPARPFFLPPPAIAEMSLAPEIMEQAAAADYALITIGRISGEFADRKAEDDFYLSAAEKTLIQNISKAFRAQNKPVIAVLNIGGPIELASWRDEVDAILLAWLPGQEAGYAIAEVLSGQVNPSGKLPTTFPARFEDDPTAEGFPGQEFGEPFTLLGFITTRNAEIEYEEGVFVGYRAFEQKRIAPAYEFGYGLSYTTFEYSDLKLSSKKFSNKITASVSITNNGQAAGKEAVQLYLSTPAKTMEKPAKELKGFAKTKLLQPGETQALTFELDARALASFDENASAWVAEKGTYTVRIGASSRDIKLKADFKLPKAIEAGSVSRALAME